MALHKTYSDANKYVSQKLSIRYSVDPDDSGKYYRVTRLAAMKYKYFGMDEDTANQCAMAKVAQYMRDYSRLKAVEGQDIPSVVKVRECKTDIQAVRAEADNWSVEISVNETDVKASATAPQDPASLFSEENARNYDGGNYGDALRIASAVRSPSPSKDVVTVTYSSDIRDFDYERIVCQAKDSESGSWHSVTVDSSSLGSITFTSSTAMVVRLLYGSIESAAITITDTGV